MKKSLVIAIALTITACGGGGGGSSPAPRPVGTASGVAHDAPIVGGTVTAYAWENGERGEVLGTATTDNVGNYSLSLSSPNRPVLMEVTGGRYIEEATGRSVNLQSGDALTALIFYETGANVDLQLTHYTTWASCLAEYMINGEDATVGDAISQSREIMANIAGIPITTEPPLDITLDINQTNVLTLGHRYGFVLAGISELTRQIAEDNGLAPHVMPQTTSIFFSRRVCDDIRADGLMDGRVAPTPANPDGRVSIGTVDIGPEHYRTELAKSILAIVQSPANRTGVAIEDILPHANEIATNVNSLFAGFPTQPVDIEGPLVTSVNSMVAAYAGVETFTFGITDPVGVDLVRFSVNGIFHSEVSAEEAEITLNTALFDDGTHTITIVASDVLGNETTREFDFLFTNTGPGVAFTNSQLTNQANFAITGVVMPQPGAVIDRVEVHHTREVQVDVGGGAVLTREETEITPANYNTASNQWSAFLELDPGSNEIAVVVFDAVGNSTTIDSIVDLDQVAPRVRAQNTNATFSLGDGDLGNCFPDFLDADSGDATPICLRVDRTSLDGTPVTGVLNNDGFVLLGGAIDDPSAGGVFTNDEDLVFEYRYFRDGELIIDWTNYQRRIPEIPSFTFPLVTEFLGDDFFQVTSDTRHVIEFRATDRAGNSGTREYTFRLDVLTPPLDFALSLRNAEFLDVPFEQRAVWGGQTVFVDYTFENVFNNGVYIRLLPGNNHQLERDYESAFREHQVQRFIREVWSIGPIATPEQSIDRVERLTGDIDNPTVEFVLERPADVADGAPFNVFTDDVPANANFVNVPTFCGAVGASSAPNSTGSQTFNTNRATLPDGRVAIGCSHISPGGIFPDGLTFNNYFIQRGNTFQSVEGHPRNDVSTVTEQFPVVATIQVASLTTGNEIFPREGWYFANPGETVRITKQVLIPGIPLFSDSVLVNNPEGVTFDQGNPNQFDKSFALSVDLDMNVVQAVDPGSFEQLAEVSASLVELSEGIIQFTTER